MAPPPALRSHVACLWVQSIADGEATYEQPVLPDGCIDIVSVNGDVVLAGPATRSVTERFGPGSVTVGLRFRPGAAPPLVGVSAADVRDDQVPISELWGRAGSTIAERSAELSGWAGRLEVMARGLVGRLADAPAIDPVGTTIARVLNERPGEPLARIADDFGFSERHLRRRVEDAVGYSPRTLARILRFQRFLDAVRTTQRGRRDLAGLAAEIGYADQAHLTRESRRLAGLPPAQLLDWEAQRLGQAEG